MSNEELALKIKAGDNSLQEELWWQVKAFIVQQARFYRHKYADTCTRLSLEFDDFMQVGFFAMLNAVDAYPEDSPYKFLTYLSRHLQNQFNMLTGVRDLASKSQAAIRAQMAITFSASLDDKLGNDEDSSTFGDMIPDPQATAEYERIEEDDYLQKLRSDLDAALESLPSRQAVCIRQFYLDEETHASIAKTLGVSLSHVEGMIHTGLLSMRKCSWLSEYRQKQYSRAFYGGVRDFKNAGSSITEQIIINIDEQEQKLKAYLLGEKYDEDAETSA